MEQANADGVSEKAVLDEVDRICDSLGFRNSGRLSQFLRYTVTQTLRGKADSLKEYEIGVAVYGRKPSYSPGQDSIVRTEARRLRNRLKAYYEQEADAEVLIYLRIGTYKPAFRKLGNRELVQNGSPRPHRRTGYTFAVLPFTDSSCTPETAASAAGITDEIIYRISLTEGCRVVALNSVRESARSIDEISTMGRDLDVQQIIYGSVQKEGHRFTILVHGLNPSTHEVWTEKFRAEPRDGALLNFQEHAASALMARIGPHRSVIRNMEERVDSACVALYPELLSAEVLLDTCEPVAIRVALNRFRGLAERNSNSARSFCGIVQCHYLLALLNEPTPVDAVTESKRSALHAIEIDTRMGEAHAALGCAQVLELEFHDAQQSFIQALELAPHPDPVLRQSYAHLLVALGDMDEASRQLRLSQDIDPFSGQQKFACARLRYLSREFRDDTCDPSSADEFGELPKRALLFRANIAIGLAKMQEAMDCAEEILKESNGTSPFTAEIAEIFGFAGNHAKAKGLAERFRLLDSEAPVSKVGQARLCIAIEQPERCADLLDEALRRKEPQLCALGVDPRFDVVREEPFFGGVLSNLKLPVSKLLL